MNPLIHDLCFNRRSLFILTAFVLLALGIAVAALLLRPDASLAQEDVPLAPQPKALLPAMTPPPPMDPPVRTPEPGRAMASPALVAAGSDVEAVRFRPQVRVELGAPSAPPTGDKKGQVSASAVRAQDVRAPEAYVAPDYQQLLGTQDWSLLFYDGFEGVFPGTWLLFDTNLDDNLERLWGDTNNGYQYGFWSAWPAAGGADAVDPTSGYPNDVDSWMVQGPFDLSSFDDVFVGFGLWYDTEPDYDWIHFCVSVDYPNFDCDWWSGYSEAWTDQAYWLTSYAGYSEVYFAWWFYSDFSISGQEGYLGPYVDEVTVWGYESDAPGVTPTPDPSGELIQNGSFETGDLSYWQWIGVEGLQANALARRPGAAAVEPAVSPQDQASITSAGVISDTWVEGQYSAYLWRPDVGADYLYQTFDVPADVTDIVLNYWFAVTTWETGVGRDFFCASLRPAGTPIGDQPIILDLGCLDSTDTTGYWQEVLYTLTDQEVADVLNYILEAGQSPALVFELYNTGEEGTSTAGWLDYVRVYATGGSGAAEYLDPNEPNDVANQATAISCGSTLTGTIGDALGGYDVDWFVLNNVPTGQLDVDIDADTQVPPSELDSVVGVWDNGLSLVAANDDDGISYDSYVVYTNTNANATYYVSVESYTGQGSPDAFYDLSVQCGGAGAGPPPDGNEQPPQDVAAWTVMLYLNAEDPGFESILTQYRTAIEAFIGSKSDFLNVVILFDGPGANDTTRYLVQPNGAYADGTNRWPLGERNMGHPDTLANFVRWAIDQYPAEHYYLSVDDHGDGVYGISWDRTSLNDQLTPPELYSALKSATDNGNHKIDIFDYEACLMGLAENAYDLREWVNYVVFFEQISWGINTYPLYFGDLAATDTPATVGTRIVNRYHAQANADGYPHTISLIDTSQMEGLRDAVTSLGDTLRATNTQGQKDAVNALRDRAQAFAAHTDATNPYRAEYIDLWDLADELRALAPAQASAVQAAVETAVVHERHSSGFVDGYIWNHDGAHGLSIYYPPTKLSSAYNSYVAPNLYQMSRDPNGHWDEFLSWVVPADSGNRRGMNAFRSQERLTGGEVVAFVFDEFLYLPVLMR
jgi:hypothetical protein